MIIFEISLWPNESELTLKILGMGTEFLPLSRHVLNYLLIMKQRRGIAWKKQPQRGVVDSTADST